MKRQLKWWNKMGVALVVLLAVGVLSACGSGGAETEVEAPAAASSDGIPELVVTKADGNLSVAAEAPSGIVAVVNNTGGSTVMPVRLNEGVTPEQLQQTLAEDEEAALGLITMLGAPMVPGDGHTVYDLQPGNHALVEMEGEGSVASLAFFEADAPSEAPAPAADLTVDLVDFAFVMPSEVKAGPQTWQITNKGTQWHEMALLKLNEGATVDDVMAMIMSEGEPAGPPPFEMVAGWAPMVAGETAWTTMDLPAGEYTVLCFLPDLNGDFAPHLAHGMVASLTVTP